MFKTTLLALLFSSASAKKLRMHSDPICASSGCHQYLHPELDKDGNQDWPINYPVAHFGMDRDIQGNFEDLAVAEGIVGHRWTSMGTKENKEKTKLAAAHTRYDLNPKLEENMITSLKNLKDTEVKLGHNYALA